MSGRGAEFTPASVVDSDPSAVVAAGVERFRAGQLLPLTSAVRRERLSTLDLHTARSPMIGDPPAFTAIIDPFRGGSPAIQWCLSRPSGPSILLRNP